MMYIRGTITPFTMSPAFNGYVCKIKTPGVVIVKHSFRSRMEALTEALKRVGLPL